MKKLLIAILSMCLFSNACFATCDFKTGITQLPDGNYEYSRECHIAVGQMRQNYLIDEQKIADLNKSLDLKDLAITKADQRADLWQTSTFKVEDRLMKVDDMQKTNYWIYFGLGVLSVLAAGYAAHQMYGH